VIGVRHTPFTHVVPVGQQTSPVDDLQGSVTAPWEFTQRHLPSTQRWPCGQQTPAQGARPVFSQRQTPSMHFVPTGQHLAPPVAEVHICPVGQHTPLTQTVPAGQQTSPVADLQGSIGVPWAFRQRQTLLFSTTTHFWPCGQQMVSHGG